MSTLLSRAQMQAMDRIAIQEIGIPSAVLMEVAGRAVADAAEELFDELQEGSILALAGTGNNGGDAAVAVRHLAERGLPVVLAVIGPPEKVGPELAAQLAICRALGLEVIFLDGEAVNEHLPVLLSEASIVLDGIFGTGLERPVDGYRREAIELVNAAGVEVVAIDVPSGLDADTGQVLGVAMSATITVTFQFAKIGLLQYPGRTLAGQIRIADVGIPPSRLEDVGPFAELIEDDTLTEALQPRDAEAHKGSFGHLLLVAGAPERPGAALLAGRAALRTGAGLVTIGSDAVTIARLGAGLEELMGLALGDTRLDPARLMRALESRSALAIGPSLPADPELAGLLREVLVAASMPVLLDAGALVALGADHGWLAERSFPTILTPHPGEMARLLGINADAVQANRVVLARRLAEDTGTHVVLKGAGTVVASPDGSVAITTRGNPGMATAGMGDVLTGIIGGLLAQGVEPGLAARAGVQLHGAAGDRAASRKGHASLVASDLLEQLAGVLQEALDGRGEEDR
jgi:hydroxyethylthiazole kinase-like uncharacterized protein yjeF